MGFLRQVGHKSGARLAPWLAQAEDGERRALGHLAKLDPRRAELAQQLPEAAKAEAAAFAKVEPAARAELAQQQERGSFAREIIEDRWQQDRARERDRGQERDDGLEL